MTGVVADGVQFCKMWKVAFWRGTGRYRFSSTVLKGAQEQRDWGGGLLYRSLKVAGHAEMLAKCGTLFSFETEMSGVALQGSAYVHLHK